MTRVNLVPPRELCDQHLLAEHREIKRIPNVILSGRFNAKSIPTHFTVRSDDHPEDGRGHVAFFYDKLAWLRRRYLLVYHECRRRGFAVQWLWNEVPDDDLYGDWTPRKIDIARSRKRIHEQMPPNPRFTGRK